MLLRKLIGRFVSLIIMPSQTIPKTRSGGISPYNLNNFDLKSNFVESTGGALINFCEIKEKKTAMQNKKVIIYGCGNYDIFEYHYDEYCSIAKKFPGATVVGFNCRNVIKSTGIPRTENDWVDDAIAVINYFKNQGYDTENILVNGHSLGGAILTMAAAKLYKEEQKKAVNSGENNNNAKSVRVISNRSFSSLADVIISPLILGKLGTSALFGLTYGAMAYLILKYIVGITILSPFMATMAIFTSLFGLGLLMPMLAKRCFNPWLNAVLWLSFGTLNALDAYKSLPDDAKDYVMAVDDGVIFKSASIHQGLKKIHSRRKNELLKHFTEPTNQERKSAFLNLKDCKLQYKDKKRPSIEAHNVDLHWLYTCHKHRKDPILGNEIMDSKIRRLFKMNYKG